MSSSAPLQSSSPPPPPSPRFKVGVIQLNSQADYDSNFLHCSSLIRQAVSLGARIVFTPENTTRLTSLTLPFSVSSASYESDHPSIPQYCQLAYELGVWINLGSVAVRAEDDSTKMANRSLLISPHPSPSTPSSGRVVARYDKVHMFDVPSLDTATSESYLESSRIRPGSTSPVVSTPFGRIGLTICYDMRFPSLYTQLALAGADIITVPSAFTVITGKAHWHTLLRARAIETGAWVIAAAQSGDHPGGRKTYGRSLVVNPWGEVVGEVEKEGEGVVVVDVDVGLVQETRRRIPSLNNRRDFQIVTVEANEEGQIGRPGQEELKGGKGEAERYVDEEKTGSTSSHL